MKKLKRHRIKRRMSVQHKLQRQRQINVGALIPAAGQALSTALSGVGGAAGHVLAYTGLDKYFKKAPVGGVMVRNPDGSETLQAGTGVNWYGGKNPYANWDDRHASPLPREAEIEEYAEAPAPYPPMPDWVPPYRGRVEGDGWAPYRDPNVPVDDFAGTKSNAEKIFEQYIASVDSDVLPPPQAFDQGDVAEFVGKQMSPDTRNLFEQYREAASRGNLTPAQKKLAERLIRNKIRADQ